MSSLPNNERLHALDALRAVAMLLGIGLHGAIAYMPVVYDLWPADDPESSVLFSVVFVVIHLFRMEAFFLMAGFFGCMVLSRRGFRSFAAHRLQRIGLPLLMCMFTLIPITQAVWAVGLNMRRPPEEQVGPVAAVLGMYADGGGWRALLTPVHLWFLEQLLVFYAVFAPLSVVCVYSRVLGAAAERLRSVWGWFVRHGLAAIPLALLAVPALLVQDGPGVDTQMGPLPPARILAYYAVYFGAGWLLYRTRADLPGLAKLWPLQLGLGLAICLPYLVAAGMFWEGKAGPEAAQIIAAPATAFLVVGVTGLFLRLFQKPSRTMRYVADSAYWLYLIHLPLVIVVTWLAYPLPAPAWAKFVLVCAVSMAVMLASYQWLVRASWIGELLNGRRMGRAERHGNPDPSLLMTDSPTTPSDETSGIPSRPDSHMEERET